MSVRAVKHFTDEVFRVIQRMRSEYDMTYAELVGCLELIKAGIVEESSDDEQ